MKPGPPTHRFPVRPNWLAAFGWHSENLFAHVQKSNTAGLIHFLKILCRHDFTIQHEKPDVARQPHTLKTPFFSWFFNHSLWNDCEICI
jgi:hypothetical protein